MARSLYICRYDLGSGPTTLRTGTERPPHVNVGRLHRLLATIDGRNATLTLDDGAAVFGSSRGVLSSLNIQSTLHVGRVPSSGRSPMYAGLVSR